jgi:hypothetical protein
MLNAIDKLFNEFLYPGNASKGKLLHKSIGELTSCELNFRLSVVYIEFQIEIACKICAH